MVPRSKSRAALVAAWCGLVGVAAAAASGAASCASLPREASFGHLPSVFLLACRKCASTWLHAAVTSHPCVRGAAPGALRVLRDPFCRGGLVPCDKEVSFFDDGNRWKRGVGMYKAYYPPRWCGSARRPCLRVDATPGYLDRPLRAITRIRKTYRELGYQANLKRIRAVVLLRNPVERGVASLLNELRNRGGNLTALVAKVEERAKFNEECYRSNGAPPGVTGASAHAEAYRVCCPSVREDPQPLEVPADKAIKAGRYAGQVATWRREFGSQVYVTGVEEMMTRPGEVLVELSEHLGLDPTLDRRHGVHRREQWAIWRKRLDVWIEDARRVDATGAAGKAALLERARRTFARLYEPDADALDAVLGDGGNITRHWRGTFDRYRAQPSP